MKGKRLKKWLAAMLCAGMLFTQSAAVLANGVDFLTPETTQTGGQTDGQTEGQTDGQTGGQTEGQTGGQTEGQTGGQTEGQTGGQTEGQTEGQTGGQTEGQPDAQAEEPENVLEYAGAAAQASDYGQSSGVIHGSAEFTGNLAMVIKLYNADGKLDEAILQENGTFRFSGLSAGEYTLRFYFYGQGSGDPEKTISCTVAQKPAPEPEEDPDAGENPDGENPDGEDPDNGNPDDGNTGDGNKPGVSAEYRNGGVYITVTGVTEDTTVTVLNSNGGSVASAVVNAQNSALRLMLDPGTYTIRVADAQTTVTVPAEEGDGNNGNNGSNDNNDNNNNDNDNDGNNNNSSDGGNDGAEDADGKFNVNVAQSKGMITVHVTDALAQAVIVVLSKPDGSNDMATLENGSGKAYFADLQQGDYMVTASYISGMTDYVVQQNVALAEGADTSSGDGDTGSGDTGSGGTGGGDTGSGSGDTGDDNGTGGVAAGAIVATAAAGVNRVDVSVTAASQLPVAVTLLKNGVIQNTQRIEAGVGSVSFTSIAAGTYSVSVNYAPSQPNVMPYQIDQLVVTDSVKGIAITGVTGGENKLTVTGTAQPGSDVTLTAEPAIPAAIVRADASGKFSATLICSAGTYTAVHAQYGADSASRVTKTGTFVVKAPAVKPPITVNPISEKDSTVIAKSTPGTIVNIGTYDYGQTLVADARGMLQFSLPHWYVNGTKVTFTVYYGNGKEFSYQHVVTVGYHKAYNLLKRGSSGSEVLALTTRLKELGYLHSATSSYNDTVVAAVRQFQKNNGLAVDGMAGQLTQTVLYSVSAIGAYESGVYPTLVRGDRGLALIYTLQQRLKDLGYYTIRVDGIFGSGTQRAVRDFQAVNGLTVTGKADHATQSLLYSSAAKPVGSPSAGGYVTLSRSSRYNARVVPMQRRLKALGYYAGSVDGYFGSQTYRAVRNFQQRNGIAVTGIADAYTQQVLYSAAAKTYSGSVSGTTGSTGYRLLYWGCKGDDVKRLQSALLSAGYTQVRTADGVYGQWTYDAVCAFQKDHGLAVDGVAGKNTQNRLFGTSY